ncbi:MAG: hypothetical protein EHM70_11505 [Chloroflexota bacterium]|nr:MAG: hypothetical protein EHM70_11505 [Chloroflexota bacterium]
MIMNVEIKARSPLQGTGLKFVRAGWVALAAVILGLFVAALPVRLSQLSILPWREVIDLQRWGLSISFYIFYNVALDILTILLFAATGAVIFWSKSDDWMALLVSLALLTFSAAINPTIAVAGQTHRILDSVVLVVRAIGVASTLIFFYLFPNGKFVPSWTRYLVYIWVAWLLAWRLFSTPPEQLSQINPVLRQLANMFSANPATLLEFIQNLHVFSMLLILLAWFGTGVFAQIYRYRCVSGPVERQQSKWIVLGLTIAFLGYSIYHLLPRLFPLFQLAGKGHLVYDLVLQPVYLISLLLVPLFLGVSISLYQLWDIDFIINRTLVYSAVMGVLGILYFGSILVLQKLSLIITGGENSPLIIAATTLVLATLFQPLRYRVQDFIDRGFYREKIDFRKAFMEFSSQVRTIIEMPHLLRVLVHRTIDLLHITHGAVFLATADRGFRLAQTHNIQLEENYSLPLDIYTIHRLRSGQVVTSTSDRTFKMLVPLIAPQAIVSGETAPAPDGKDTGEEKEANLLGIMALGPRLSGQAYSREDQALLVGLADQAGTALYVAGLIEDKQVEARRREEAERHLQDYRNSPAGRAEAFAQALLAPPGEAFCKLHGLAQTAGKDPLAVNLLANLPSALENINAGPLISMAEGFNYLFTSQFTPELLPAGLRSIIASLTAIVSEYSQGSDDINARALEIYRLAQSAIDVNSIAQITVLLPELGEKGSGNTGMLLNGEVYCIAPLPADNFLAGLVNAMTELHSVADALRAYERVDTSQDKLAYLASAVERLRHVDRLARSDLGSADRSLVQRIVESWLASVAGAMSELQTRARLVSQLLTRHTWQDDVISLVLNIRNEGRGAALNLKVTIAPSLDYSVVDEMVRIERLGPGEESQVQLRVRPKLAKGVDNFRARFVVLYTDPRGPDQVENFADVIQLMATESTFEFIPNPYVVGTPLQTGSPLFFGREEIVGFIKENLEASHRNNLVLIGQRRTGKTSLLKQLPARLGDDYLPVYIDGQALGLDPGMANLFLTLATEITFALEDRGFQPVSPQMSDFTTSPAASFEREFLPAVRRQIGTRHLLLMLDEFEELESAVQRGDLEPSIFGFLRHLIQHQENLSVIFCGTHRLEELASDYWNVLFNISLYKHITFLEKPEALRLIEDPVRPYGMCYDDLALDKIWRVTAGHPYFLQLLCHSLVNQHNKSERSYVTVADVNTALDEILASGEAHFVYLYTESAPIERLVLTALSRMIPLTGHATPVQTIDYLDERGVNVERQQVSEAMHRLALRGILREGSDASGAPAEIYAWELGLLGLWVEKYKSWSRVVDEM